MREILFRGKRTDNGEWVEGLLMAYSQRVAQIGTFTDFGHYVRCDRSLGVDPATVGQYTGLMDKNGKRIFEEDILEFRYGSRYPVFWDCDNIARQRITAGDNMLANKAVDLLQVSRDFVAAQPAADVAPVVRGEWIKKPYLLGTSRFCSKCGKNYGMPHGVFNYCPNCGAMMEDADG